MDSIIRGKRPFNDRQNMLESENKANKKPKLHTLDTCLSLGDKENQPQATPAAPVCRTVHRKQASKGFIEQLYDKLIIQQNQGKLLHIESHVEEIRKDLCRRLKAKNQAIQTWGDKDWYDLFLEIKNKTCLEALTPVKVIFSKVCEGPAFTALIQDAVAKRQAWWNDKATECPSKEDFIQIVQDQLGEGFEGLLVESVEHPTQNSYARAVLKALKRFLEKNVFQNNEDIYLSSFNGVQWFQFFSKNQETSQARKAVKQELSRQMIEGLKATGELVLQEAEESLEHLDALLDLLNPNKGL